MAERSRPSLARRRKIAGDGEPEVFVADEQSVPIELERWRSLALATLLAEGVRGNAELTVLFVDEATIAELNETFMDKDGPTDVLAFPLDGQAEPAPHRGPTAGPVSVPVDHDDIPVLLGDVLICASVAAAQAPDHAGTFDDELALLVVHGVLHILGYDHVDADQAERMQERERQILEAAHWEGPAPVGFRQDHRE